MPETISTSAKSEALASVSTYPPWWRGGRGRWVVIVRSAESWALISFEIRILPRDLNATSLSTTTSISDHGHQTPAAERAGEGSLLVECRHRCRQPREGSRKRHASSSRVQCCCCPSYHDQGMLPPFRDEISRLTCSQDSMLNELEYVELGLFCADICRALDRGMGGKRLGDLSQLVCDAMNQLTT